MSNEELVDIASLDNLAQPITGKQDKKFDRPLMLPKGKSQVWPIIGRLVMNRLKSEALSYHTVHQHSIEIGGIFLNVPCQKSFGSKCPFCEKYWEGFNALKAMPAAASEENAPAEIAIPYKKAKLLTTMYKQRMRYGVLIALPKDPNVYMFFMGPELLKATFGDGQKKIPGATQELKEGYKVPIYSATELAGWISFNRTGEGLATKYSAKTTTIEVINGRVKTEQLMEEALHQTVQQKINSNDLPKLAEYHASRRWTDEEMENFIASNGTQIPERYVAFINREDKPTSGVETASLTMADLNDTVPAVGDSDVPW
jgi:hypothetical protein